MKILLTALILLFGIEVLAQDVGEIKYQYKNELYPYDSGVSISDRQYQFIIRNQVYNVIHDKTVIPPPKIVIQEKEVRKKGDGNRVIWSVIGVVIGVVLGVSI